MRICLPSFQKPSNNKIRFQKSLISFTPDSGSLRRDLKTILWPALPHSDLWTLILGRPSYLKNLCCGHECFSSKNMPSSYSNSIGIYKQISKNRLFPTHPKYLPIYKCFDANLKLLEYTMIKRVLRRELENFRKLSPLHWDQDQGG